jgi:DNA invertase Pin-like site-specific DNA recombinase
VLSTIQHLEAVGVDPYLAQQSIDTITPAGKLLFQMTGAFAEFERSMIPCGQKTETAESTVGFIHRQYRGS